MQSPFMFFFAFIVVLALIGLAAWLVRRFANSRLGANTARGRMPRLAVIDAAAVDGRRRLVLVRRDNVEHLLMIGGPSDIVVEPNIVRAMSARDQVPQRPAGAAEPPPRIAPLPDAAWGESEPARADIFEHPEPAMPEPPPRPSRPSFADEMRRPPGPPPERRADPLAGFTPEPMSGRAEPRMEPRSEPPLAPRLPRSEPMIPTRPPRAAEPPKAPPPVRAPERAAAPPPPPPPAPPPPAPAASNADANLAEMAQRLEAALRRPAGADVAPPVAPEPPPARPQRSEAPAPAPQKTGFENLEDEMASLLGRPKNSSS
jgi:flagellar protein FliO/FliZ